MIDIRSEVGRLRRVLMHAPGPEVDRMVPDMMEELLFDDILFGERARDEHRRFRRLLEVLGVEVLDAKDLLVTTLECEDARQWLLRAMLEDVAAPVAERMRQASPEALADIYVHGVRWTSEADALASEDLFEVLPVPNWCFQRDPQIVIGGGVVFSSMATQARAREVLLSRAVFRFHPGFRDVPVLLDPLVAEGEKPLYMGMHQPRFEGGDVMVLSSSLIAVGHSERTNRSGVRHLVRALKRCEGGPRWLVVASLPHKRAYMHLDTVITQIDQARCLVFPPVILPGHDDTASTYAFDLHAEDPRPVPCTDLMSALRERGMDLEPVPCGGEDAVAQQREQWTDGANALALAPGVIVLYERNVRTAEALAQRGYAVVDADAVIDGRAKLSLDRPAPICILLPSNEISRARGGPHCLTHGLWRDPLSGA